MQLARGIDSNWSGGALLTGYWLFASTSDFSFMVSGFFSPLSTKLAFCFIFLLLKNKNCSNEGIGCSSGGRVAKTVIISVPFSQIHCITKAVSWHLQVRYILPEGDKTGNCTAQRIALECPTPATFKVLVFVGPFQPRPFRDSWVTQPPLQGAHQEAEAQRLQDLSFSGLCMDSAINPMLLKQSFGT